MKELTCDCFADRGKTGGAKGSVTAVEDLCALTANVDDERNNADTPVQEWSVVDESVSEAWARSGRFGEDALMFYFATEGGESTDAIVVEIGAIFRGNESLNAGGNGSIDQRLSSDLLASRRHVLGGSERLKRLPRRQTFWASIAVAPRADTTASWLRSAFWSSAESS